MGHIYIVGHIFHYMYTVDNEEFWVIGLSITSNTFVLAILRIPSDL